jgi:uncharacterized membrane protein
MHTRAAVGGHPVHAMLVHFPIAFLVGVVGFDVAAILMQNQSLHDVAGLLLPVGLVTGAVAAVPGIVDLVASVPRAGAGRRVGIRHAGLSTLALLLFALAWTLRNRDGTQPGVETLALEALGTLVLLIAGRLGAELVMDHHIGPTALPEMNARHDSTRSHR